MKYPDVPIVMIEAAGPVEKSPLPKGVYGQGQWKLDLIYVLEDGRRVPAVRRYRLKREAVAAHASLPAAPPRPLAASFDDNGEMWGTRETFDMRRHSVGDVADAITGGGS